MSKTPKPFNFGRRTPPATPPCSVKHDSPPSSLLPSSSLDTWNAVSTIQAQTERCRFLEAQLVVARQNRTTFLDEFKAMRQTMEVISTGAAEMRRELEDERNRTARAEKSLRETEQKREQAERALEEERERSWQMRNSMKSQRDLNQSADELEAVVCGRYYNQWELISRLKRHSDIPMLQFQDVPWPTFKLAVSLEDITLKELKRFLRALSRSESGNERYTRKMIKDWLLVWHPDKFRGKWLPYVTESDKNLVHRGVVIIAQLANDIKSEIAG